MRKMEVMNMMSEAMWNGIRTMKNTKFPFVEYDVEVVYCVQNAVEFIKTNNWKHIKFWNGTFRYIRFVPMPTRRQK